MASFLDTAELLPSLRTTFSSASVGSNSTGQLIGRNPYRILLVITLASSPSSFARIWPGNPVPNPGGWQLGASSSDNPRIHSWHAKDYPGIVQEAWFGTAGFASFSVTTIEVSFDSARLERMLADEQQRGTA